MIACLPLLTQWRLRAQTLPGRMTPGQTAGFSLPGAQDLQAFSDLLGQSPQEGAPEEAQQEAPFALPAWIPPDVTGPVSLVHTLDLCALRAQTARLIVSAPVGRGQVTLDGKPLATFDSTKPPAACTTPGELSLDLTPFLTAAQKGELALCFDETRPCGVGGPVLLHLTAHAQLNSVLLTPDAARKHMQLTAGVWAREAGTYSLRAQAVSGDIPLPAWEITLMLDADEHRQASLSIPVPAEAFVPGVSYPLPVVKVQLFLRTRPSSSLPGVLCDSIALSCGYRGRAAFYDVPLTAAECLLPGYVLLPRLLSLHLPGVCLPVPAPDALYDDLTRAGIAVRQITGKNKVLCNRLQRLPSVTFQETPGAIDQATPPELSAWQLCGLTAAPRPMPGDMTADDILLELSGRALDPQDAAVRSTLAWLDALCVRLRAEAARQGRLTGALCAPGDWNKPDIADALACALSPVHLSPLPLRGAWWTGAHFSASLWVFTSPGALSPVHRGRPLTALATLIDKAGKAIARHEAICPPEGGDAGVLTAMLPEQPCVLQLSLRLMCGEDTLEESVLPVYVGARGMLEAAF